MPVAIPLRTEITRYVMSGQIPTQGGLDSWAIREPKDIVPFSAKDIVPFRETQPSDCERAC